MAQIKDMTEGKPIRLMIKFSIPLLISNSLQLLFTVADSAIVGRILGVNAFASVGVTASPHWLILSVVFGMSHGFSTLFAQRFGAKDEAGLRRAFVTAAYMAAVLSVTIGLTGVFMSAPLMDLLRTPPEIVDGAVTYLSFLFGGLPITFAYNLLAMTLYGLGDSKTPLKAMAVATVLNIAFDFALVIPLGIAGVAMASLLAQTAAFAYCWRALRKTSILKGCGYRWDKTSVVPLLKLAVPLGFRNGVIEVGGLLVQRYVNEYGTEFVAGIAAAKRMYALIMIAGGAIEASIVTFVAQNFGAGRFDRVRQGVKDGLRLALMSAAVVMAIALPFGRSILSLLIDGEVAQVTAVLDAGSRQLLIMTMGLPILHLLFLYRAALQGIGNTFIPMISGFVELGLRVFSVLVLTRIWGVWGIYLSDPLGWPFAMLLLVISYFIVFRKLRVQSE